MFRELKRKNKQISDAECIEVLTRETRGVLSVIGDEGYPYGMPMNHFYDPADGKIWFHCGKASSHRTDALRRDNRVSFCVTEQGERAEGDWAYTVRRHCRPPQPKIHAGRVLYCRRDPKICRRNAAVSALARAYLRQTRRRIVEVTAEEELGIKQSDKPEFDEGGYTYEKIVSLSFSISMYVVCCRVYPKNRRRHISKSPRK